MIAGDGSARLGAFRATTYIPRTRLVAIGAASNALGTITDIGARGAVGARSRRADFRRRRSLRAASARRCPRVGLRFPRLLRLQILRAAPRHSLWSARASRGASISRSSCRAPDTAPERAETGTQNHEGIAGAAAAVDFLASLGAGRNPSRAAASAFKTLHERASLLVRQLWNGLAAIEGVQLYGPRPDQSAHADRSLSPSRAFLRRKSRSRWREKAIFVSHGDFYATTVVERLGHAGDGLGPRRLRLLHHERGNRPSHRRSPRGSRLAVKGLASPLARSVISPQLRKHSATL